MIDGHDAVLKVKPLVGVMKTVTLFDRVTGEIHGTLSAPEQMLEESIPPECDCIDGEFDGAKRRVDVATREVVPYQPPAPDADSVWDAEKEEWFLPLSVAVRRAKNSDIMHKIEELEQKQLRATREILLARGNVTEARQTLETIDDQIALLRAQLEL
jgi:hypothetical protein